MGIKRVTMSYANWSKKVVTMKDKELKERFFALYFGQQVLKVGEPYHESFVTVPCEWHVWNECSMELIHLELKPLHSISDEDLNYIGEYVFGVGYEGMKRKVESAGKRVQDYLNINRSPIIVTDYLRSKGYAIPFMGISVEEQVEKGWIKLVE